MKHFVFIILLLSLMSCATSKRTREHWDGVCVHPGVNGGMPFTLTPETYFDGTNLGINSEDGAEESLLPGAVCVLQRPITKK